MNEMTLPELIQLVLAKLPNMLPAFFVEQMGGREEMATKLREEANSSAIAMILQTAITIAHDVMQVQQYTIEREIIEQLDELAKTCPGAGADGMTPVRAASMAYKTAIRVVHHSS